MAGTPEQTGNAIATIIIVLLNQLGNRERASRMLNAIIDTLVDKVAKYA